MLRQRVITALILAPLIGWGIYALPQDIFTLVMAIIIAMGAWEWTKISHLQHYFSRILYITGILLVSLGLIEFSDQVRIVFISMFVIGIWWSGVLVRMIRYRFISLQKKLNRLNSLLAGLLTLGGCLFAIVLLRENYSPHYLLALMFLVWGADTFAYFAGKKFGRRKLLPEVSPGKTIEGIWGALAGAVVVALVAGLLIGLENRELISFVFIGLVTVVFSVIGDLNESLYKRKAHIKDSGSLLPGHGGILDRIDSLTAAAPVYLGGLMLLKG